MDGWEARGWTGLTWNLAYLSGPISTRTRVDTALSFDVEHTPCPHTQRGVVVSGRGAEQRKQTAACSPPVCKPCLEGAPYGYAHPLMTARLLSPTDLKVLPLLA